MAAVVRRGWLAAAVAAVAWAGGVADAAGVPPRVVGPFEITAHVRRVGDSGRWMRTGNPFGTYEVREYSVSWKGRKVSVPGAGERFWQALHLTEAPQPALLLASGPNLHLVSEADGRLHTRALAPESGSGSVQWLDARDGQPGEESGGFPLDRVEAAPATTLAGGRWLYLRHRLVLDVRTLATIEAQWLSDAVGVPTLQ